MKFLIIFLFSFASFEAIEEKSFWWNHTTIYELPVIWFKDSDNDGIGDFKGVTSKLDYLKDLGIPAIKLSPIYSSSYQITDIYPVTDFFSVHSDLGTMEDFSEMVKQATIRGIKIILNINLNHCHLSNEWFQKSIKKIEPYTDYFIWNNGKIIDDDPDTILPPNNWKNQMGHTSWKWNSERKQFFYNYYNRLSPDLNLRNPNVVEEITKIFEFWFLKGVSGFNLLNVDSYLDDQQLNNDWISFQREDFFKFIGLLRKPIEAYNKLNPGKERMLTTKPNRYDGEEITKYLDLFELITIGELPELDVYGYIPTGFFTAEGGLKRWFSKELNKSNYEWLMDSANTRRIPTSRNKEIAEVLLMIQTSLLGAMSMYYGAEIGMGEHITHEKKCISTKWEYNDGRTLPMQWDTSANAGFSKNDCLLQKVNPEFMLINVEVEKDDKLSTFNFVKKLLKLRSDLVLNYGSIKFTALTDTVLLISRKYEKTKFNVLVNLNNIAEVVLLKYSMYDSSYSIEVLAATPNSFYQESDQINPTSRFVMRPMSGIAWKSKAN